MLLSANLFHFVFFNSMNISGPNQEGSGTGIGIGEKQRVAQRARVRSSGIGYPKLHRIAVAVPNKWIL